MPPVETDASQADHCVGAPDGNVFVVGNLVHPPRSDSSGDQGCSRGHQRGNRAPVLHTNEQRPPRRPTPSPIAVHFGAALDFTGRAADERSSPILREITETLRR